MREYSLVEWREEEEQKEQINKTSQKDEEQLQLRELIKHESMTDLDVCSLHHPKSWFVPVKINKTNLVPQKLHDL